MDHSFLTLVITFGFGVTSAIAHRAPTATAIFCIINEEPSALFVGTLANAMNVIGTEKVGCRPNHWSQQSAGVRLPDLAFTAEIFVLNTNFQLNRKRPERFVEGCENIG